MNDLFIHSEAAWTTYRNKTCQKAKKQQAICYQSKTKNKSARQKETEY